MMFAAAVISHLPPHVTFLAQVSMTSLLSMQGNVKLGKLDYLRTFFFIVKTQFQAVEQLLSHIKMHEKEDQYF